MPEKQTKPEIDTLYEIIQTYLEESNISIVELVFLFEQIKFELFNTIFNLEDDEEE